MWQFWHKKITLLFLPLLYWVKTKFCCYVTIFVTHWAQKNHLTFSSSSILSQDKILLLCDNFCNKLGTKESPCFFFLFYISFSVSSILSQDKILLLCDNFCNTLSTKKITLLFLSLLYWVRKKFCCYVTIFVTHWAQKNHLGFSSSSILPSASYCFLLLPLASQGFQGLPSPTKCFLVLPSAS